MANGFTEVHRLPYIDLRRDLRDQGCSLEIPGDLLLKEGYLARGVFLSLGMVAVDIATLDMADMAPGKTGSTAGKMEAMDPDSQEFMGKVGMSQRVTANTCADLGIDPKEYELVQPPTTWSPSASPGSAPGTSLGPLPREGSEARRLDTLGRLQVQQGALDPLRRDGETLRRSNSLSRCPV